MNKLLSLLLFLCLGTFGFAQNLEEGEKIAPDRPGFGDAVSVLEKSTIHIETGSWFEREKADSLSTLGCGINSTLFRYGLLKRVELRLDYNLWNQSESEFRGSKLGFYPFRAGMKFHLLSNKGILPSMTFIGMQELPFTATKNFKPDHLSTDLQLSFANSVTDKFAICYNLGTVLNVRPVYYYALSAEFGLNDKTGCYLQVHGSVQNEVNEDGNYAPYQLHYLEAGFMFYPNHNAQIDLSGGIKAFENFEGKSTSVQDHSWFFISVGFSWRTHH